MRGVLQGGRRARCRAARGSHGRQVALQRRESRVEHPPRHRRSRVRRAVDVVLVRVVQLVRKLVHDVPEDHRVEVLPEDVEEVPVAHLAAPHDSVDVVAADESEAHAHHVDAHARREDDDEAVDEGDEGEDAEDDEPEPQEDVDLLVDDVERQDAQRVVALHLARRPELVEQCALHHPVKYKFYVYIILKRDKISKRCYDFFLNLGTNMKYEILTFSLFFNLVDLIDNTLT